MKGWIIYAQKQHYQPNFNIWHIVLKYPILKIYFTFHYCIHVCLCVDMCICVQVPEEARGAKFLTAGVTGDSHPVGIAENQTGVLCDSSI